MKIANVIYEKELVNHTKVDYINYYKEPLVYDEVDKSLPTLYVGWSFMKASNPDNLIIQNANILQKKIIGSELYWEFSFEESKASHVKGIENFINLAPQLYFAPKYQYINLDPIFFQLVEIEDLMAVLPKEIDGTYNLKNEIIYVLKDNKISGINLKMYEFFKFNIEEITSRLMQRTSNSIYDFDGTQYQTQYKIFPNFTNLKRYLVVIMTK